METSDLADRAARAMELRRAVALVSSTLDDVLVALARGDFEAGRMYMHGIRAEVQVLATLTCGEAAATRAVCTLDVLQALNTYKRYARRLGMATP